ncbi:MAG: helix-turn-helix transcriptional regulator [Clostridia bacterium]|nr:helix-turn-helix transcriptional regulator [Clostridia bacterium]
MNNYTDTYTAVRNRLMDLLEERQMTLHKLSTLSGIAPSTIKNIIYGKSINPGIVTLKILCDGLGISIVEFFSTEEFKNLEQEIK